MVRHFAIALDSQPPAASGQQQFCIEIKDSKGKRMALLAATNAREQVT